MGGITTPYNNPIGKERWEQIVQFLELPREPRIVDIGCGEGELLHTCLTVHSGSALGIDVDGQALEDAAEKLAAFGDRVRLKHDKIEHVQLPDSSFDLVVCVSSTHAFGPLPDSFDRALSECKRIAVPGGLVLFGHMCWNKVAPAAYLSATGIDAHELGTHRHNVSRGEAAGLLPIYATTASAAEWDHFESASWAAAEFNLREIPGDEALEKSAKKRRAWRRAYLEHGRQVLGFGAYVFLVP
jgi:ubiquinone/menaquinone biosynthesis C-methylase UbiE